VTTGSFEALTNQRGQTTTAGLSTGQRHIIKVKREGFGPPGTASEVPVQGVVDLRGQTQVTDGTLALVLEGQWGRVKSGNIVVEGDHFRKWYPRWAADTFPEFHPTIVDSKGRPRRCYPGASKSLQLPSTFTTVYDDLARWTTPEISLEQFISVCMIMANETGASFTPIAEGGGVPYMFYLNRPPNRLAGDQLKARAIISSDEDVAEWNSRKFPGIKAGGPTEADLKECDFFKYRGRGFIQCTWFKNYIRHVDPALRAAGLPGCETITSDELDAAVLTNSQVYYPMLKSQLDSLAPQWAGTNGQNWRDFGLAIAGVTATSYGDLFHFRCSNLFDALSKAARDGKLELK
jgi:hypothetical protein